MPQSFEALLSVQPFLRDLKPEYLSKVAEVATYVEFEGGKFIFRQHESADYLYLILQGRVDVELFSTVGGPVVLQTLESGEALGWSWLVEPHRWSFDARAVENTRAIALDARLLREKMNEDRLFGFEILEKFVGLLARRLESASLKLLGLYAAHS